MIREFEQIVKKYPAEIAIIENGAGYSYDTIYTEARHLATYLQALGIGAEDVVGIQLSKSKDYIVSLLGIWMAGAAFMPLDPSLPQERRDFMVGEAQPKHIVTDLSRIHTQGKWRDPGFDAERLAYVIYTSGSTGKPKGVMVTHRGIVNLLQSQIAAFGLKPGKKSLFYLATLFDASISDIGTALLSGATLVIDKDANLLKTLTSHGITHMDMPPSLLRILKPEDMPETLETIIIGGEPSPPETVRNWARKLNVINVYGPTEATVCTSLCRCDAEKWERPLLGNPLPGISYHVIGEELYIEGIGLARGYLNRPELTEQKFVAQNGKCMYKTGDRVVRHANGDIEFMGRIDRQFKLRGQLVEPEEIESLLRSHPGVTQAAVLKRPLMSSNDALVAFISPAHIPISDLRNLLSAKLPVWMIPDHFETLDALPRTATGKTDTQALKNLTLLSAAKQKPENLSLTEEKIYDAWKTVLKHDNFGIHDHFLSVGGDSLGVIYLTLEAERRGLRFSPALLVLYPTIHTLARALDQKQNTSMTAAELRKDVAFSDNFKSLLEQAAARPEQDIPGKNIFLTGATGFLGGRLLSELLDHTDARIYCLVRDSKRLKRHDSRIVPITGDITAPRLGLNDDTWNELCSTIDSIYHCAATVNMVHSYETLRPANVGGVKEILRLAATGRRKHIHYASTLSVFVATDQNKGVVYEDNRLENTKKVYGGYAQSKWAAEYMLYQAPAAAVPVTQYRFGLITGDTVTGACCETDFLRLFVRGIGSLGVIPPVAGLAVDITPVDYAARKFFDLSRKEKTSATYHIANPEALQLTDFVAALRRHGVSLTEIPADDWRKLETATDAERAAWLSLCRVLPPEDFDRYRTMDLFQATHIRFDMSAAGSECPKADNKLLDTYLDFMIRRPKKICIFGPESTGKSTLAEKLAEHFGTNFVPEFAKELITAQNGAITLKDIPLIAKGQLENEDHATQTAKDVLFCDTDLLTTSIWSDWLFKECPGWIRKEADRRRYDLYLLTDIDVPWMEDVHRYLPQEREAFMKRCIDELEKRNLPYVRISGDWKERFTTAVDAVEKLMQQKKAA